MEDQARYHGIRDEIADIAIYLVYLCNDLDINLMEAIQSKLKKNASKYPKENLELYCDNKIYKMTNYLELEIFGDKIDKEVLKQQDKGHLRRHGR